MLKKHIIDTDEIQSLEFINKIVVKLAAAEFNLIYIDPHCCKKLHKFSALGRL